MNTGLNGYFAIIMKRKITAVNYNISLFIVTRDTRNNTCYLRIAEKTACYRAGMTEFSKMSYRVRATTDEQGSCPLGFIGTCSSKGHVGIYMKQITGHDTLITINILKY